MSDDKVAAYLKLLNESLKYRKAGQEDKEDNLLSELDVLWYSMSPEEMKRAESSVAIIRNYHSS